MPSGRRIPIFWLGDVDPGGATGAASGAGFKRVGLGFRSLCGHGDQMLAGLKDVGIRLAKNAPPQAVRGVWKSHRPDLVGMAVAGRNIIDDELLDAAMLDLRRAGGRPVKVIVECD